MPEQFSLQSLTPEELKFYRSQVNNAFFYRGYPAALAVAGLTYYGLSKKVPHMNHLFKVLLSFGTSIVGNVIARDHYMSTVQKNVYNELPPSSYLRQSVENGIVFKAMIFSNADVLPQYVPQKPYNQDEFNRITENELQAPEKPYFSK